ncbi:guanine nucleotide exchange protein for ADP-robosylation factor, partial [Kickxella alabastrina]
TDTHGQPKSHSEAASESGSESEPESENKSEPEPELENETSRPISDSGACSPAELSAAKHAQPEPVEASAAVYELADGPLQDEAPPMPATGLPGLVFIVGAVDKLLATREGKKKDAKPALDKMQQVLAPKAQQHRWLTREEIDTILEAFGMLCVAQSTAATLVIALDCIEKLVSFHYFDNVIGLVTVGVVARRLRSNRGSSDHPVDERQLMRDAEMETETLRQGYFRTIADRLVEIVSRCYQGEGTADNVQLQIVKALFALISSDRLPVRQSSMLNTIRTAYNVFVLARSHVNQTIAQGTLTQMVHLVLSRAPVEIEDSAEDSAENPADVDRRRQANDGAVRDAFLLLRALCKLSMRQIPNDHALDGKSPQLRSRCLALNLIRLALSEHTAVFVSSYVYLRSNAADNAHNSSGGGGPTTASTAVAAAALRSLAASGEDEFGDTEGPDHAISQEIAQTASRQLEADGTSASSAQVSEQEDGSASPPPPAPSTVAVPLIAVIRQYLSLSLSRNLVSSNAMVLDLGLA